MITSSRPLAQPLFAGKQKKTPNPIKAGLIGLLLGSAGGAAALGNQPITLNSNSTVAGDSLSLAPYRQQLKNPPSSAKWDALISTKEPQTGKTKHNRKLLQETALPPLPAETPEDQAAREILQQPPFAPTDVNLFNPSSYPEASPTEPAPLVPQTDENFKVAIEEVLNKRFQGDTQKVQEGLALFDDPILKAKISPSRLRAAVAIMKGTACESAIDYFKSDAFGGMKFKVHGDPETNIASMVLPEDQNKLELWVNPRYIGEDFRLLPFFLAFEATNQDLDNLDKVNAEPLIAFAAASLEYLKLLTLYPELAQSNTELTRMANTMALNRYNTRDEQGNLRLFTYTDNTKPGSVEPYRHNVGELFEINDPNEAYPTPGNDYLKSLLKNIAGKEVENPDFSTETLKLIDDQVYLSPTELIKAGQALKLNMTGTEDPEMWDGLTNLEAPAPAPSGETRNRRLFRRYMA